MIYSHSLSLPWSVSAEDERRFRKVTTIVLVVTMVLGVAIPMLPVFKNPAHQEVELPPRVAKLIFEKMTEPKPRVEPVQKPKPEPKPEIREKPEPEKKPQPKLEKQPEVAPPKADRTEQARKKAATAGLLAMQDALADLRGQSIDDVKGASRLTSNGSQAKQTERALITSKVGSGSQGINTSRLSRDTGSTRLAGRTATEVQSTITSESIDRTSRKDGRSIARSIEEIQIVFDRNKSAIYSLYNRALRNDPTLQGKLVLSLTIDPSGKITDIELISSELREPDLERKLVQRIKMFNFGAKQVDAVTITYPIDFLPT
ncbi:MAG: TonB family protein [Thiogranum sp.]|nr:TonB family protein [Thiogranum sp.]